MYFIFQLLWRYVPNDTLQKPLKQTFDIIILQCFIICVAKVRFNMIANVEKVHRTNIMMAEVRGLRDDPNT